MTGSGDKSRCCYRWTALYIAGIVTVNLIFRVLGIGG